MDLNEVRQSINIIDYNMKGLYNDRMDCSALVAQVKLDTKDQVYKPLREKEICERYADDKGYLSFIKKVMQISRKSQYNIFLKNENLDKGFVKFVNENPVFSQGGSLELKLYSDSSETKGLGVKDILSIISDTALEIGELKVRDGEVRVTLKVENDDASKWEAMVLSYMLYMETLK